MMDSEVASFRATARELRGGDKLDAFREHFGRTILKVDMVPVGGHPLSCDMAIRAMPDLALAHGSLSPVTSRHEEDSCDDVVLVAIHSGQAELRHGRRSARVESGEAVLTTHDEPGQFTGHTATHLTNIRFRRQGLVARGADPDAMIARPLPRGHHVLRLLLGYADVLGDPAVAMDPQARSVVTSGLYDLVALLLPGERPPLRDARAMRLVAIQSDIRLSLGRHDLSITDLARRHGISGSYARRLFAEAGTSFTDFVLEKRLTLAHRHLTDAAQMHRTISAIAYEVGFGDLSYFNRRFRQRYGMTPTEARALGR